MNAEQLAEALRHSEGKSPRVYVFCRESSHEEREWDVQRFLLNPRSLRWITERTYDSKGRRLHRPEGDWVNLFGNRHFGDKAMAELPDNALSGIEPTDHYEMTCKLCGLRRRSRGEKLHPILDTLATSGVTEVSLSWLAARL